MAVTSSQDEGGELGEPDLVEDGADGADDGADADGEGGDGVLAVGCIVYDAGDDGAEGEREGPNHKQASQEHLQATFRRLAGPLELGAAKSKIFSILPARPKQ